MDLTEVERLMRLMKEHDLVEIELEDPEQGSRIRLRKATPETNSHPVLTPTLAVPATAPATALQRRPIRWLRKSKSSAAQPSAIGRET